MVRESKVSSASLLNMVLRWHIFSNIYSDIYAFSFFHKVMRTKSSYEASFVYVSCILKVTVQP